jgi:SAM-dependent methyltransferase
MSDAQRHEAQIVRCWELNATAWTAAVRTGGIPSRRLVTDQAILAAVASCAPRNVLDIGCGEGWLARALAAQGIAVLGVDVVPELIAQARAASGGDFRCLSYEALAAGELGQRVDLAVCNFSLLGKESTEGSWWARCRRCLSRAASSSCKPCIHWSPAARRPTAMAGGPVRGMDSVRSSAIRHPGISGRYQAGLRYSRRAACNCGRCRSRCTRIPNGRPR